MLDQSKEMVGCIPAYFFDRWVSIFCDDCFYNRYLSIKDLLLNGLQLLDAIKRSFVFDSLLYIILNALVFSIQTINLFRQSGVGLTKTVAERKVKKKKG